MKRIPEPELMEDEIQARAYALADFSEPHSDFIRQFQHTWPDHEITGHVLDLGCGPADISIRFANSYTQCCVDGIDASEAMLRYGRQAIAQHHLEKRVNLYQLYLPRQALSRSDYDVVISNSLLHHLHDPMVLWTTIKQNAKQDAPVFIMDLLRPANKAEAQTLVNNYAGNEPEILQHDFYHSLLAAYSEKEVKQQLDSAGLDYLDVKVVSDRHLTVCGLLTGS